MTSDGAGPATPRDSPRHDVPRLAVCVCTFRRPALLGLLLERILRCADEARDEAVVGVVIVDDDPERSAEGVARDWADRFAGGLVYASTGSGNISTARNEALQRGSERADLLALIDDDCIPDDRWLSELVRVQRRFDADLVSGHCVDVVPDGTPDWVLAARDPASSIADGAEVEIGYVKNLLVDVDALRRHGWSFDPDFGRTGGEDAVFFYRASAGGANHRHAAQAVVREPVPAERLTFAYQCRRGFWYGSTEARTTIATGRASRRRAALRGARMLVTGVGRSIGAAVRRRRDELGAGVVHTLRGTGMLMSSVGVTVRHH